MAEVDNEILISLVQERPILWDKTEESYKDRLETRKAWMEVFKELEPGFEEMGDKERNDYGKTVMKKWTNLRDSFQRSEKTRKSCFKSGSGRQLPKTYIYAQQLQFLQKVVAPRSTDDSLTAVVEDQAADENTVEEGNSNEIADSNSSAVNTILSEEVPSFKPPEQVKKRKKRNPDPVELELIGALKQKPNRHISFFNGIIPSLDMLDDDEVVEFQLKVMQILSEVKKTQKGARKQ